MPLASFFPVHELNNPGASLTAQRDNETGLVQETLNQILSEGSGRVYVDNTSAVYSDIVATEAANAAKSPFTAGGDPINWGVAPSVAVVGGGMSGLLTAYQLAKSGMSVALYEAGPAPTNELVGAGRIAPALVVGDGQSAVGQLGAMRFPSNAYLFWHYMKLSGAADGSDVFTAFPNVSKVPTTFTGEPSWGGSQTKGVWAPTENHTPTYQTQLQFPFAGINDDHLARFNNYSPYGTTLKVKDVAAKIAAGLTAQDKIDVDEFWSHAIDELYDKSYYTFMSDSQFDYNGVGFSADDIQKIGYMGIGTGGFGPLFSRCALEIIRLFIWSYDNEFAVPNLGDFPKNLYEKCQDEGVAFSHGEPVNAVVFSQTNQNYVLGVPGTPGGIAGTFDYVVLAMTNQAAQELLSSGPSNLSASTAEFYAPNHIFPFYDSRYTGFHSDIKRDLEGQDGMDSVKIIQTMSGPASNDASMTYWQVDPNQTSNPVWDPRVRTSFGNYEKSGYGGIPPNSPLGLTYIFPTHNNTTASGSPQLFSQTVTAMALHYNWGAVIPDANWPNEANEIQSNFLNIDPGVQSALNSQGKFFGNSSQAPNLSSEIWRVMRARFYTIGNDSWSGLAPYSPYFSYTDYFKENGRVRDFAVVRWSKVPYIKIGFKLDRPDYGANLIYAYKVSTEGSLAGNRWDGMDFTGLYAGTYFVHPSVKQLYFAGDAVSQYGGWVEGAFQSALNTTAGIIQQAATKEYGSANWHLYVNAGAINSLVAEARDPYTY